MKKILSILVLSVACLSAKAQSTSSPAIDTVTNAATENLQSPSKYFAGSDGVWTAGVVATRISGTAAGYAILQATVDGTNWAPLRGTSADSVVITNTASQFKNWYISGYKPKDVRIQVVGSGTQSLQVKGYFIKN